MFENLVENLISSKGAQYHEENTVVYGIFYKGRRIRLEQAGYNKWKNTWKSIGAAKNAISCKISYLSIARQLGISEAAARLAFWDSKVLEIKKL